MAEIRYTLVADGGSDRRLEPIINWTLLQSTDAQVTGAWADLSFLKPRPTTLRERLKKAVELYPCDLLFIHRDAEGQTREQRLTEIATAISGLALPPVVQVVPVRMQEAWFLFDADAIREAAGNPRGTMALGLPGWARMETVADPKELLFEALRRASGKSGRHLRRFREKDAATRLASIIADFSPLRQLSAFEAYESIANEKVNQLDL